MHNRLRRLVFLGTPFVYKRWGAPGEGRRVWPKLRWLNLATELAGWSTMLAVVAYALIEVAWLLIALATSFFGGAIHWPTLNTLAWPMWLHLAWLPVVLLPLAFATELTTPISETNLYCEDTLTAYLLSNFRVWMRSVPVLPLRALVITSGFLDEVLLAMFCEPIIKAVMDDRVNRLVFETRQRMNRSPTGIAEGIFTSMVKRMMYRLRMAAAFLLRPLVWPMRKLLARYLRRKLFELVKTAARRPSGG